MNIIGFLMSIDDQEEIVIDRTNKFDTDDKINQYFEDACGGVYKWWIIDHYDPHDDPSINDNLEQS